MSTKLLNQVSAFQYVTAPKAPTYRAIVQVFYEAKQHYIIELRPDELFEKLRQAGYYLAELDQDSLGLPLDLIERRERLEQELQQLVRWGNLTNSHDLAAATCLQDFYRARFVYRLTSIGEAAHRAVLDVEATVGRSGSLQTAMLVRIRDALASLAETALSASLDGPTVVNQLRDLCSAFDSLTAEAGRFLSDLDRYTDSPRLATATSSGPGLPDADRFLLHKQAVLSYISSFVDQLRRLAGEIASSLAVVQRRGIEEVLLTAVAAAELPPSLEEQDPRSCWLGEQRARFEGICCWFLGQAGAEPTVERLRAVAVGAVIKLTRGLGRLNERRAHPADRAADFRALARWFQRCPDDDSAHRLYQAAFGVYPARHFHIAEENPGTTSAAESFWQASPVAVPVRLRSFGHLSQAGRPPAARDYSSEKQWIAARRRREREALDAAYQRFLGSEYTCISDLATLEEAELDALLSLLSDALAAPRDKDGIRRARTSDGRYQVSLRIPPESDTHQVVVMTPRGWLRCRDFGIRLVARPGQMRKAAREPQEPFPTDLSTDSQAADGSEAKAL